jgi:competence protein ComGC
MRVLQKLLRRIRRNNKGQTMVEYLLVMFVLSTMILALVPLVAELANDKIEVIEGQFKQFVETGYSQGDDAYKVKWENL